MADPGTYDRAVAEGREADYWFVELGRLNHLNGPGSYPFASLEAATRFARAHKQLDPHRHVEIVYPDGRRWDGKRWVE